MASRFEERRPLRLAPFLVALRKRLDGLSRDELTGFLIDHARTLEPREREGFLAIFSAGSPESAPPASVGRRPDGPREAASDEALLDDIDALAEELRAGEFFEGWGWDHEFHEERAWGDESWAPRMDALFDRAGLAVLEGDPELAAEAYRRLFRTFEIEDDEGPVFSGALPPDEMLETDLTEAQARFARVVYETTPPSRRPPALLAEVRRDHHLIDRSVGLLRAMEDAREAPLADLEEFLSGWIEALERSNEEVPYSFGWGASRRYLLREAVRWQAGASGLAGLARRSGDPEAFLEWAETAVLEDDLAGALGALAEGLDAVPDSRERSRIADRLASLAAMAARWELALCARRLAWRLEPTRRRLRDLAQGAFDGCGADEDLESLSRAELRALREGEYSAEDDCAGLLEILAGDLERAERRLAEAPVVGWSSSGHPGKALFPILLVAGAGAIGPPQGTILAELWDRLDAVPWAWSDMPETAPVPPALSDLVTSALLRRAAGDELRGSLLGTCRAAALGRARHIVSNTFRRAYDRAAAVAVACAEGFTMAGRPDQGRLVLETLREEFPRHSAFRRSLEEHERRSALPASPAG